MLMPKESLLDVQHKLVGPEKFIIVTLQDAMVPLLCLII
jgi:hypothetical protein